MKYLRERILEPILIPVAAIGLIGFGVLNFSRFFLATGGLTAVVVASVIALTILLAATLATAREEPIERGTLLGGLALLGLVLSSAGLLAQQVDLDHVAADDGDGGAPVSSVVDVTAVDIDFTEKDLEASPGNVQFNYVNEGESLHTLVIEGLEDQMKLEVASNGATDTGQIELAANGYVFYCDVPGHREAGMEGQLTVEEGLGTAPEGGGGAAGGAPDFSVPAVDIDFPEKEFSAEPGEVTIEYVNEGSSPHTLVVEGREDELVLEVSANGDTDVGSIELEAGTFTLYCDIPGHREAGMEGTLTVAEGGGGGGGGPPEGESSA